MSGFTEISPSALSRLIGTPQAPHVLDVRIDADFAEDPFFIPLAQRVAHTAIVDIATSITGPVVVACQKGKKLSHGAAALLRSHGIKAEVLEGGTLAWKAAGHPTLRAAAQPTTSLWVTRYRPKIDRIACPWLLRRFVQRDARILFVPPAEVADVAIRFGATAFDVPDAPFHDHAGQTSFDAICGHYGLSSPALDRLAKVIRAADSGTLEDAPEAAGLLAFSVGLSRMYRTDTEQLEAGIAFYDALYRWARDGAGETHSQDRAQ